jgi:hypothetical protein
MPSQSADLVTICTIPTHHTRYQDMIINVILTRSPLILRLN